MEFPHDLLGRVNNVAVLDTLGTAIMAIYLSSALDADPSLVLGLTFLAGWAAHLVFVPGRA